MMRLLLDENISPALVRLLADIDVYSQSVPHLVLPVGRIMLSGSTPLIMISQL